MYDNYNGYGPLEQEREQLMQQRSAMYLSRVMGWMFIGLLTTFVVMVLCIALPQVGSLLYHSNAVYAVIIAQLVVAVAFSAALPKIGTGTAKVLFLLYSALTGVTFTGLCLVFQTGSLLTVFCVTAAVFGALSLYGMVTKRDLTRVGSLAMCGLFGIIIAGLANWFLRSSMLDFGVTVIGIVVFLALTAYDTQRIKAVFHNAVASGYDEMSPELNKFAIYGAFTLYLDFINLFLKLLRVMGKRRR